MDVKQFGAKGDGVTNDTAAIQAALNAAVVSPTEIRSVYFPAGKYMVTGLVNNSRVAMVGSDPQNTALIGMDATTPIITYNNDLSQVLLRNITIDRSVPATAGGYGIYSAASGMGFHFENLYIRNQDIGLLLEGNIAGAWFVDSMVMDNVRDGVRVAISNMTFSNVYSMNNGGSGFYFYRGTGGLYMTKCESFNNGGHGVWIGALDKQTDHIYDVLLEQLSIGTNLGYGILLDSNGANICISDSFIEYAGSNPSQTALNNREGIYITPYNQKVDINNCIVVWNAGSGMTILADGVKVNGGIYALNSLLYAGTYAGIVVGENVKRTIIRGVSSCRYTQDLAATQGYGIKLLAGADEYLVADSDLKNNLTGAVYLDTAVGKKGKIKDCMGFNPIGAISPQPAVPASGVVFANSYSATCQVLIHGGGVTWIGKNGQGIAGMQSGTITLEPNETIQINYTSVPYWTWFGM